MRGKPLKKVVHIGITVFLMALVLFCGYRMIVSRIESEKAENAYAGLAKRVGQRYTTGNRTVATSSEGTGEDDENRQFLRCSGITRSGT